MASGSGVVERDATNVVTTFFLLIKVGKKSHLHGSYNVSARKCWRALAALSLKTDGLRTNMPSSEGTILKMVSELSAWFLLLFFLRRSAYIIYRDFEVLHNHHGKHRDSMCPPAQ